MKKSEVNTYSPLTLAFMGDAVYEQLVRDKIVKTANMPVNKLHTLAVLHVKASYQSAAVDILMPKLTEDEIAVFKRGRNATSNTVPKSSNPVEYRRATGLEALFGYLYLLEEFDRINEIFEIIWEENLC